MLSQASKQFDFWWFSENLLALRLGQLLDVAQAGSSSCWDVQGLG